MAEKRLEGKKIAILVANGFEEVEMTEPKAALEIEGAHAFILSPIDDVVIDGMTVVDGSREAKVQAVHHGRPADVYGVDVALEQADPDDYDALLLPGGRANPDQLRMVDKALQFVRHFDEMGKPIAAICHGPWTMVSAGIVKGRTLTSWPSLQTDIRNAGGHWMNREVIVDDNWVTSRGPADIPAFNRHMIQLIAEGAKPRTLHIAHAI